MSHAIFVYGTLKSGHSRNLFLKGQRYLGTALTVPEYSMFRYGSFPAMIESSPGKGILGEIYEVDDPCLIELDEIEGVKHGLFHRRLIKLKQVNFVFLPVSKQVSNSLINDNSVTAYLFCDKNKLSGLKECDNNWTIG